MKDLGIGIIFEKENINTLDAKGEVLLTILSSLAQDESRSISENCTWGIRRRFETGKHKMSTKRFLGYDTDETGKLVINRTQEPIVVRLYQEFLDGKTTDYIKRIFEREGVKNWDGGTKWQSTTLMSMLENEKYKGDALLQKSYTVDFLTKKRTQNKGEIQMFYVEDDHDAIISKRIWECVQLEINRRKKYLVNIKNLWRIRKMRLDGFGLFVDDMAKMIRFYKDVLGFEILYMLILLKRWTRHTRRLWKMVQHLCLNRNLNLGDREPAISLIRKEI